MSKEIKKNKKRNKGFTLIEMLVAVLILGILVAIGVPTYLRAVEKSRTSDPINTLKSIAKAEQVQRLRAGEYTNQTQDLDLQLRDYPAGNTVAGDTFEGQYYTYKVYGEDEAAATAGRKTTDEADFYELSVDYGTGELFCRPSTNKTCIDLNLEEGQVYGEMPWNACNGAYNFFKQPYENTEENYNMCEVKNLKRGNKIFRLCSRIDKNDICYDARIAKYDAETHRVDILNCPRYNPDGTCTCMRYAADGSCEVNGWAYSKAFIYDFDNNIVTQYGCYDTKYLDEDGICHRYGSSSTHYYNSDNNIEYTEYCYNLDEDLNCNSIQSVYKYTYDSNNNRNSGYLKCAGHQWNHNTKTCSNWVQE